MSSIKLKSVKLASGETLGYREREGGDKVVLFVHGNMTSSKHWDVLLENFDECYKLYAVDLRGFGISSYNEPIDEIKDFSKDVRQFVEAVNIQAYAIVGWSMGGSVALQYCSNYENACEKLLLLASGSTRGYPFFGTGTDGLPDVTNRLNSLDEVKADVGKTQAVQGAYDRRDKEFLKTMWNLAIYRREQPDAEKYDEYLEDMMTQRNLAEVYQALNIFNISSVHNGLTEGTNEVENIKVPVLVMWGNEDIVVTEQMTKEILEDLGDKATYVELTNCGHSPLIDDLNLLVTNMEDFLSKEA